MATTIALAGGNNITLSTAANAATISGPNTHAQQTAISGLANSETTYTSGTVSLSVVGGAMTIRSTTGQAYQFSVSQSVQAETQTFIGGLKNTETTYTSGTVELEGTNNITVFSTTGQRFRISGANTHAQQTAISGIANSETTYTSGTVSLSALGALTIRSTTGNQYQFSVNSQTNQSAIKGFGASNTGNTAGNTGVSTGVDWVLAGSTNITVSESTAVGGPNTLWLSAPNAGAGAGFSAGASNLGNTAGSTGVTGTRVVLVGSNNNSLSQSTDANGATITINDTQPSFSGGVSNLGNTAGSTGVSGTRLVFVGSNDITLSQSTNSAGATISLIPPAPLQMFHPYYDREFDAANFLASSLFVQPLIVPAPGIQYDRMMQLLVYTQATNSTLTVSVSQSAAVYTRNGSSLSLLQSTSSSFSINGSGTARSNNNSGLRGISMGWTSTLTAGNYWLGLISSSNTAGNNATLSAVNQSQGTTAYSGMMGVASGTSVQRWLGNGVYSAGTNAFPSAVALSEIRGTQNNRDQRQFVAWFVSGTF